MSEKTSGSKCVVIGLDGATFDLILPWIEEGHLPTLRSLMEQGAHGYLRSTLPFISAPAWVSFLTGQNPGRHGIFGFRNYDLAKYTCFNEKFVTSASFAGKTIFDLLSPRHRIAAVCVPMTYPAWPINGEMIAGFPAPPSGAYTFPASLASRVPVVGMPGDFHTWSVERKIRQSQTVLDNRLRVTLDYLDDNRFDIVMVVFNNPDDANHHFWKYVDTDNPDYSPESLQRYGWVMKDLYQRCDDAVGRILARLTDEDVLVVLSDHGGMPTPKLHFNTNYWLSTMGLLKPKKATGTTRADLPSRTLRWIKESIPFKEQIRSVLPQSILEIASSVLLQTRNVDWSRTKAYRVPMHANSEGIQINMRGRQPQGIVADAGEFEELRTRIIDAALNMSAKGGEQVVREAFRKEEEYSGPHLHNAPDIILHLDRRYLGGSSLGPPLIERVPNSLLRVWGGAHSLEGILIMTGPMVQRGVEIEGTRIQDVAPTLLHALHEEVPGHMDGRVVRRLFTPKFLEEWPVRRGEGDVEPTVVAGDLSPDEEEQIASRLRGMGYL